MARTVGRRPIFFTIAALVCLALVPVTPSDLRWVDVLTGGIGLFWAVLLAAEDLAESGGAPRRGGHAVSPSRSREATSPFDPPPRPGAADAR